MKIPKKLANEVEAFLSAGGALRAAMIRNAITDIEANKRSVTAAAQGLARSIERLRREVDQARSAIEDELEKIDEDDPRRPLLEKELDKLEEASIPEPTDITQGVRDVLADAKVRIS